MSPLDLFKAVTPNWVAKRGGGSVGGGTPPVSSVTTTTSGIWGAGFQNAGDVALISLHGHDHVLSGGDVAGVHLSQNDGDDWRPNNIGLTVPASLRCAGLRWSGSVANKAWYYSSTATGAAPGGVLRYGFFDSTIGGIVKWLQLCTVPSGVESGLDAHPRGSKRQTIALDEANDLLYLATIDGIYKVVISTGVATLHALSGSNVTSVVIDPQDRTVAFATTDSAGAAPGVHRITAFPTAPSVTTRNPTDYQEAQSCVAIVEGSTTVLYVATGKKVDAAAGTNSVVRWNGTSFGTAGNWTDLSGSINSGNTNTAATRWSGIDAAVNGANTRILVTSSSDVAQASAEVNAAWTNWSRTGTPTWTKPITTTNTLLTINDGTGATWWASSLLRSLMLDKNVYDSTCPVINPNDSTKWFLFGRSGVWRSVDSGAHWYPAVRKMAVTTAWHVTTHPTNAAKALASDVDWTVFASNDAFATQPITPINRPATDVGFMISLDATGGRAVLACGDRDANINGAAYTNADPWSTTSAWTNETIVGTNAPWSTLAAAPRCLGAVLGTNGAGSVVLLAMHQGATGVTGGLRRKVGLGTSGAWSTPSTAGVTVGTVSQNCRTFFAWPNTATGVVWMLDPSTGVWQSLNYGATWTRHQTFSSSNNYTNQIRASASELGVYYFTRTNNQLWKITGGDTASPTLTQIGASSISAPGAIAVHPTNGKLVCIENGDSPNGNTLWLSTDGGTTFVDKTVPSWETTCITTKTAHFSADGTLWQALYAGYAITTGL